MIFLFQKKIEKGRGILECSDVIISQVQWQICDEFVMSTIAISCSLDMDGFPYGEFVDSLCLACCGPFY